MKCALTFPVTLPVTLHKNHSVTPYISNKENSLGSSYYNNKDNSENNNNKNKPSRFKNLVKLITKF